MFEFRFNLANQKWVLLETNARFWGSSSLPLSLGVDFPRYLYDLLVHQRRHAPIQYAVGVTSRNVVLDGLNLFASLRHLRPRQILPWIADFANYISQPVRWLTGRERSDTFVRDDLAPALWECAALLRSLREKRDRSRCPELDRRRSQQTA